MSSVYKKYTLFILVIILIFCNVYLFKLSIQEQNKLLIFAVLDVGQGDGIFIESPSGTQILIDGGPQKSILGKLTSVMSPLDKNIDAIIITNPDADHIGGFLDVLKKYKVEKVFEPGTFNDSKTYQNLKNEIKRQNIPDILAKKGMRLDMGGSVFIDILFPDRNVSSWNSNDGSIVAKLTYGTTSIMLTGDSTKETENIILSNSTNSQLGSNILKVGHHGSHTSTSKSFVKAVSPKYAVISLGKNNKYGHPHKETLETLQEFGVKIFRTDLLGTIIMKSDGQKEVFSFAK